NLTTGTHTFTFYGREAGAWIDKIRLTSYSGSAPIVPVNFGSPPPSAIGGISIISPSNGEPIFLGKTIPIKTSTKKVYSKVEFYLNNQLVSSDTSKPYEYFIQNPTVGSYSTYAKGYSGSSSEVSTLISFNVKNKDPMPAYCIVNGKDECAELKLVVDRIAMNSYSYICDNDNDGVDDNDGIGWGEGYKLQSISSVYKATRDTKYLDVMRSDINALFCIEDNIAGNNCASCPFTYEGYGKTPQNTQKEWGWYGDSYSRTLGVKHDYVVAEGLIVRPITEFIEFVRSDPVLEAEYGSDADAYLAQIENLFDKWNRRGLFMEVGDGSGVYQFLNDSEVHMGNRALMSLPHNQQDEWMSAMLTLYGITGDIKYRDRAAKMLYHLKKNFYYENNIIYWDYWNHEGLWDYIKSGNTTGGLRHAEKESSCGYKRLESEAIIEGWKSCLVMDDNDMAQLKKRLDFYYSFSHDGDYNCVYPGYDGFYDKSILQSMFNKVENMDDNIGTGYPWQSVYKIEAGHFLEVLNTPYSKNFVCNIKDVPIYENFNGATTDFSAVNDITAVSNVVLEKSGYGKIEFGLQSLDMANLFLDAYVTIGNNLIVIEGDELPELDTSATVTLYNVNNNNPVIMKELQVCTQCNVISSGQNVKFTIPGAGMYKVKPSTQLLFSDDFESGNLNKWPVKNDKGKVTVTSEASRAGIRSMKVLFDGQVEMYVQTQDYNVKDYIYKVSMMIPNSFWISKDIRFSFGHDATSAYGKNIIMIDNKGGSDIAVNTSGFDTHMYMQYSDNSNFQHWVPQNKMNGSLVNEGNWHDLEYHFKSDPNGYVDFFIDGKFIGRSVMGDTSNSMQKSFRLGVMPERMWGGTQSGSFYLDNFEVYRIN
ncbi:MAG: Ig-like domain-containing protein, partial [archaeon]|nr:Ig-like domain-containing protein [archaeon]